MISNGQDIDSTVAVGKTDNAPKDIAPNDQASLKTAASSISRPNAPKTTASEIEYQHLGNESSRTQDTTTAEVNICCCNSLSQACRWPTKIAMIWSCQLL